MFVRFVYDPVDPVVVTNLTDDAQIHACLDADANVAVPSQRRNRQLLPPSQGKVYTKFVLGATARDSRTNICNWLQTMARTVFEDEFVTEHNTIKQRDGKNC